MLITTKVPDSHILKSEWSRLLRSRGLSEEQVRQLCLQLAEHGHDSYEVVLNLGTHLPKLVVYPHVMRPDVIGSSRCLANYLAERRELFLGKTVLDMGCGSGIQGIVAARSGAKRVIFSDIVQTAITNTRENIERTGIVALSAASCGDLFEPIQESVNMVIFNHPFFPGDPIPELPVTTAMLAPESLLARFFEQAKQRGTDRIVMPFFHLAGPTNDPGIRGPLHGYRVIEQTNLDATGGLQQGRFSIYELSLA